MPDVDFLASARKNGSEATTLSSMSEKESGSDHAQTVRLEANKTLTKRKGDKIAKLYAGVPEWSNGTVCKTVA